MWLSAYPCEAFLPLALLHLKVIFTPALLWSAICVAHEWCLTSGMDFLVVAHWFLGAVQLWAPDVQVSDSLWVLSSMVLKAAPKVLPTSLALPLFHNAFSKAMGVLHSGPRSHNFDNQPSKFIAFFQIPLYFYFLFAVFNSPVQSKLIKFSINRLWLAFKVL